MNISKETFNGCIKAFQFKELFNDMGWNHDKVNQPIAVDTLTFILEAVAQKSGFKILNCKPGTDGRIPEYALRKKIDQKVTKLFPEHLIIYTDSAQKEQLWQLAVRQWGKPVKVTETRYKSGQSPELLYQRAGGLFFTLDEEEKITIVDVTNRVAKNFQQNNEKVTKKFYEGFQKQHKAFLGFIKGIQAQGDRDWYASLMLNRLMFCYFIQKKGFLDKNRNYLSDKLKDCKGRKGKFYSFYRSFLLTLFHKGLGAPSHSKDLKVEIGQVPYLNGGLFDEHEIEKANEKIDIEDVAFERLFDFFEDWEWHLDTRDDASGKEINPDVIGYIFEKYINDRAKMGAYYTKEDITDYIGKNSIIPFLFDEAKRNYPEAFVEEGKVWKHVQLSGDKYIHDTVKKGVPSVVKLFDDLPEKIQKGFNSELEKRLVEGSEPYLCDLRKDWNEPAPSEISLPSEIYREVIERRKRCAELRKKISGGEISTISDFITYNLNIRQFAQDLLEEIDDPDFIREFYKSLCKVTILDPTCGSGAFLFAALNILEPLYEACIMRMRAYVGDEDRENFAVKKTFVNKYKFFREILAAIKNDQHPNEAYFIYKSIILNNLYGVDIMNEAVEIAKLRLFLKLVATVDVDYRKPNLGLEPLPDVDFNIRAGNTLIGYATKKQVDDIAGMFVTEKQKLKILEECDIVARDFARYKEIQLSAGDGYASVKKAKDDLNKRLHSLTDSLNKTLYAEQYNGDNTTGAAYRDWLTTHRAFHWFAEFYQIVQDQGGFDVIIGNPPYLENSQIDYQVCGYKTFDCKAVHVYCIERSLSILHDTGNISMIVPLALISTQRMALIQELIEKNRVVWYSNYSWRPAKLFDTVNRALTIFNACSFDGKKRVFSTNYQMWASENRDDLMEQISFSETNGGRLAYWVPKISKEFELAIIRKIQFHKPLQYQIKKVGYPVYYRTTGGLYWKVFTDFPPYFKLNGKSGSSSRETNIYVESDAVTKSIVAILSSDIFWYWYTISSNLRDLNPSDISNFPVSTEISNSKEMQKLGRKYLKDLTSNSQPLIREQKNKGTAETQSFIISKSKPVIDEIDKLLAQHYGFTQCELDFIINYDIKYRMGLGKLIDEAEDE